jgi:hypothetical protein
MLNCVFVCCVYGKIVLKYKKYEYVRVGGI